ncbi:hypothetical protein NKH18_19465 [Streptomyces sp. M10(2022)]
MLLDFMEKPKYAKTWHKVNDQVFAEVREGSSGTRLLIACEVPGSAGGQLQQMPLEVEVADPGFGPELRAKLLTTYAQKLTTELGCTNAPSIPTALPK